MSASGFDLGAVEAWADRLETIAAPSVPALPVGASDAEKAAFVEGFRDEFGARNASVGMLLRWVLGIGAGDPSGDEDPDVRIWRSLIGLEDVALSDVSQGVVAPDAYAIEHRTLIECSSLHALAHAWVHLDRVGWSDLRDLIEWHTRELQPDNGINRPWGIHAFVARGAEDGGGDALMHAQTMLHNCCVTLGRPDRVSAVLMTDAAGTLRRLIASSR